MLATIDQGFRTQIFHVQANPNPVKMLRKLPHVFGKVLELPLRSDTDDVAVEEKPGFLRFTTAIDPVAGVRAHAVEIHPGVVKVVVRKNRHKINGTELFLDELEIDMWRFRLPASTRPELATAEFINGELIVTVPKGGGSSRREIGKAWAGDRRLVLV